MTRAIYPATFDPITLGHVDIAITHGQKPQVFFALALAGNPNIGKSTVFNALTGFALAAFCAWKLTVIQEIIKLIIPPITNTQTPILIL